MSAPILLTILGATVVTFAIKAFGPVLLGGRELPGWFARVIVLTSPPLMAALVVTSVLTRDGEWRVNATIVGLAAAAVVIWRRGSVMLVVLTAVVVTAAVRAIAQT
jgi:branched-subunit amino acid transport protein